MAEKRPHEYNNWIAAQLARLAENIEYAQDENALVAIQEELIGFAKEFEDIMTQKTPELYDELLRILKTNELARCDVTYEQTPHEG